MVDEEEEASWSGEGNGVKSFVTYLVSTGDYGHKFPFNLNLSFLT